ncbi:MAG: helix-turn-helix transcriptional regulator [Clostridia bacterium]|nr:helix-turn-helix transcriptional regulator [Clostridia bacterium]
MLKIRELRKTSGMTMKELGSIVGVSEGAISHYETGRREPDPDMLGRIANALNVSVDYLMGRDDETESPTTQKIDLMFRSDIQNYLDRLNAKNRALLEEMARKLFELQQQEEKK